MADLSKIREHVDRSTVKFDLLHEEINALRAELNKLREELARLHKS